MAMYHLKVNIGSRGGGQSASAKRDYIERDGRYTKDAEDREHVEHGHMPAWAQDDPRTYWAAADAHERANGRLYREIQFALPNELSPEARRDLAGRFAEQLTAERLPYTLAIHKGVSTDPDKPDNPHAHLMFSERVNDGIERSADQWFKRHNPKSPEHGGAKKSRAAMPQQWLEQTREAWQETANLALERAGREERIDGRSLADRRDAAHRDGDIERAAELSREPNVHLGPERYREDRGEASATVAQEDRVKQRTATAQAERDADRRQVERLEQEIAAIGARLQETYDRVRRAVNARVQQASRAVRAGADAAIRAGRELSKAGAAVGRAIRAGAESAHRVGEYARGATTTNGRTCHDLDRRLRVAFGKRQQNDRRLQQCYEGVERTFAMIHPEAEQKRKDGDRPDRVEGLIESRIQNRIRNRSYDIDR